MKAIVGAHEGPSTKSNPEIQEAKETKQSPKGDEYQQKMTESTRDKSEKDEPKCEDAEKAPLVQELLDIAKKRVISKMVDARAAELCEAIEKSWEQEGGKYKEKLEWYEARTEECEDRINQINGGLAQLDCLIKEYEAKVEAYKLTKSFQVAFKKAAQVEKKRYEQKMEEIGDMIINRGLEVGDEIQEAYRLAKEEVEKSAI
ncbi:unnamed protein product [Clonostachys rosea]|uniref:Uncharacterized protein n=1 Tax=Bionectria ochroleuca TaxID=29856 RepID=A0ABY6UJS3_BIOOC|nr:unnamed protein product [Clonostachys rosea]